MEGDGTLYVAACFSAFSRWPLTSAVMRPVFESATPGMKWPMEIRPRPTMPQPNFRPEAGLWLSCASRRGTLAEIAAMAPRREKSRRVNFISSSSARHCRASGDDAVSHAAIAERARHLHRIQLVRKSQVHRAGLIQALHVLFGQFKVQ